MKLKWIAAAIVAAASTQASAQQAQMAAGLGISTVGPQIQLSYRQSTELGFRGFFAGGVSQKSSQTEDGVTYDVSGNLGGIGLLMDYYQMNSGLRLSGGIFSSNTDVKIKSTISAATDIGGTSYSSGTIDGTVKFARQISPMVTVGYDWTVGTNWTIGAEVGAILNNGFSASATAGGGISQADLDREMANVESNLNKNKFFPYVSLMASYRF